MLALLMESCKKEHVTPIENDDPFSLEDNNTPNNRFSLKGGDNFGGGDFENIVDPDNDDDDVERDNDGIVDPDNDDDDVEHDNN